MPVLAPRPPPDPGNVTTTPLDVDWAEVAKIYGPEIQEWADLTWPAACEIALATEYDDS